jgi:hypothetical protein
MKDWNYERKTNKFILTKMSLVTTDMSLCECSSSLSSRRVDDVTSLSGFPFKRTVSSASLVCLHHVSSSHLRQICLQRISRLQQVSSPMGLVSNGSRLQWVSSPTGRVSNESPACTTMYTTMCCL